MKPVAPPVSACHFPARVSAEYDASQTVRTQSTCLHRPAATASIAAVIEPICPGSSPPPLIHVGRTCSASSMAMIPPSLIPDRDAPG